MQQNFAIRTFRVHSHGNGLSPHLKARRINNCRDKHVLLATKTCQLPQPLIYTVAINYTPVAQKVRPGVHVLVWRSLYDYRVVFCAEMRILGRSCALPHERVDQVRYKPCVCFDKISHFYCTLGRAPKTINSFVGKRNSIQLRLQGARIVCKHCAACLLCCPINVNKISRVSEKTCSRFSRLPAIRSGNTVIVSTFRMRMRELHSPVSGVDFPPTHTTWCWDMFTVSVPELSDTLLGNRRIRCFSLSKWW